MVIRKSDVLKADSDYVQKRIKHYSDKADIDLAQKGGCIIRLDTEPVRFQAPIASQLSILYEQAGWTITINKSNNQKDGPWYIMDLK